MLNTKFQALASLCSWTGRFESYLVTNPKTCFLVPRLIYPDLQWMPRRPFQLLISLFDTLGSSLEVYKSVILELPHDKTNKMTVRPAKTQISLGFTPVWSVFAVSQWVAENQSVLHADREDSDQAGRMSLRWAHMSLFGFVMMRLNCWFFTDKKNENTRKRARIMA